MPVAKTYSKFELSGVPFKENGRMYVNVIAQKGIKKVRWYSDAEYKRMYPDEVTENDIMDFNAYHAFGFDCGGFITIYKGDIEAFAEEHREYFWRNLTFGYYTPSNIKVPELPASIIPIQLKWEEIRAHDTKMRPHEEVRKIVESYIYTKTESKYQGEVNEWLQETVTIREKTSKESHFGTKHTYTLVDSEGNSYIWETGAKDYTRNTTVSLKMKVKEHKEINGEQCTVVWYCKEI